MTYFLTKSHPWSHLTEISSRQTFKATLRKIGPKMWPLQCKQDFTKIWPSDLLFDPIPPMIELDSDIIKTNILSKFDEDWTKTVASGVFTRFVYYLTYCPCFWSKMTHIWSRLRYIKTNILSKLDEDWTKTVASGVFTRYFYDLTYWPSFWPNMTHTRIWPRYCQDDHSEQVWWRLDQKCGL